MSVQTVTPALKAEKKLFFPFGVLVAAIDPESPAGEALQPGDVITLIEDDEIRSAETFEAKVAALAAGPKLSLTVARGREIFTIDRDVVAKPKPRELAAAFAAVGEPLLRLDTGGHQANKNIAFTPDGGQLVSASNNKVIRVWDLATGTTVRTLRGEAGPALRARCTPWRLSPTANGWRRGDGRTTEANTAKFRCGDIRLYDFASGELKALLKGHENVVASLAFSPDGTKLISGSFDRTAILWDIQDKKLLHRLKGHTDDIYAVGFTPDGEHAVTGAYDRDLRLWRVADGTEIARMTGHSAQVQSLAVARDGTIASGDRAGEIRLWDGRTGAYLRTLANQKTMVGSLSFSSDGRKLLSTCGQGHPCEDRVFEVSTGHQIADHQIDENIVLASAFSPDGRWAATGGGDNEEIHVWDPKSGARRKGPDGAPLSLAGTGQPVWAAGFSADGRQIGWGNVWERRSPIARGPLQFALALPQGKDTLGAPHALDRRRGRASAAPSPAMVSGRWPIARAAPLATMPFSHQAGRSHRRLHRARLNRW